MANIASQSTRTGGRAGTYAKKDAVAISAINASVPMFEQRLAEIRAAHGKDGLIPKVAVDENGKPRRDANGAYVIEKDSKGRTIYDAKYVEAYSLVQSFGHEELDPDDPDSWTRANELGRAVAADRFPGHPVLIATEVNGRSGCVHNHLIVGAVHPETGKSIDSNVVTHSRLSIAHDRVLAENGFEQRADMKQMTLDAETTMEERRAEVIAAAGDDVSPSELKRRLLAAENSVKLESTSELSPGQQREAKRLREFDRYRLNEQDREAALDVGVTPPKEKFSEIELESRIKDTINDPRATSWEAVAEIGRQNRVTIERRGENDVTYGMMLAQPDGTIGEPSRAHRRRGGVKGAKTPGLGDGFRRDDVEAAIERNVAHHRDVLNPVRPTTAEVLDVDMSFLEGFDSGEAQTVEPTQKQIDERQRSVEISAQVAAEVEQHEVDIAEEPVVAEEEQTPVLEAQEGKTSAVAPETLARVGGGPEIFRSQLRDVSSKSVAMQERLDKLAPFEERWHQGLPSTPAERIAFEQEAAQIGIGPKVLARTSGHMSPELHSLLTERAEQARHRSQAVKRKEALDAERSKLKDLGDDLNLYGTQDRLRDLNEDLRFETGYIERVSGDRENGVYTSREHERHEHRKQRVVSRGEEMTTFDKIARAQETSSRDRDFGR